MTTPIQLDEGILLHAIQLLSERDHDLQQIVSAYGTPPLWAREEGFHTLIHIILEQQVSLASAKAAYDRLMAATQPLTPESFLMLDDASLKSIGFSRQKTSYGRYLAEAIASGRLNLSQLNQLNDADAKAQLMQVKGIGLWTAEIYLLMALRRPDIWPAGDLGVAIAIQQINRMETRPSAQELIEISLKWQPWRAVATRILWHLYLSQRQKKAVSTSIPHPYSTQLDSSYPNSADGQTRVKPSSF